MVATALNTALERIGGALREVRGVALALGTASEQVSATAAEIASGAQGQASALEQTAASLEEMTGTVGQNADGARAATEVAGGARDVAERGGDVVSQAIGAMQRIDEASRRIGEIITTIDEIAFQTNLLTLNAAVEAARAGEQGRGFAVVAAEVRVLAQRSASAAREIKTPIAHSVETVGKGSLLVNRSGEMLQGIVQAVQRLTLMVAEIAAASTEQPRASSR